MKTRREAAAVAAYYDRLVDKYGHDTRACDYGHPASQRIKFDVLAGVAPLKGKTLLDVGCGFADYAEYLRRRFGRMDYTGIDLSGRMIEAAREIHPRLSLRMGNILEEAGTRRHDIVSANGIFYLLGRNAPSLLRRIVRRMFALSRVAVAFNSLSAWAPKKERGEFYADPLETLAFCRTLTPWVVLRHDYHPRDFTIYMYKERPVR